MSYYIYDYIYVVELKNELKNDIFLICWNGIELELSCALHVIWVKGTFLLSDGHASCWWIKGFFGGWEYILFTYMDTLYHKSSIFLFKVVLQVV